MSNRAVLAAWRDALRDSDVDTVAKAVAFVIATYFDRDGTGAFPSKATIAAGASVRSKRTADAAIERLVLAGFLIVERSPGRRSNVYTAALPTVQPAAPSTVQRAAPSTVQVAAPLGDGNRAADDTQPCSSPLPTVQPAAPECEESDLKAVQPPVVEWTPQIAESVGRWMGPRLAEGIREQAVSRP